MDNILNRLKKGENLSFEESKKTFENMMSGNLNDEEISNFLTLLSDKGETSDEIAGGVFILRNKAQNVNVPEMTLDTCGTGGDGKNTLNISTASALLLSSIGIKVAKHGNKSVSSKCGSADVLEALGININHGPNEVEENIKKNNFGFMFAPKFHSTMKYVAPIRKRLGRRTIFNLIGPLSSPAKVKVQLVGVFDKRLLKIFANALKNLKLKRAMIVCSQDGLDEISPYSKTDIVELRNGEIKEFFFDPKNLNLKLKGFENLIGQDSTYNAERMLEIFEGVENDFSNAVCLNAAAALMLVNDTSSIEENFNKLKSHIQSGKVINHLNEIKNG